jgi:hypothetical protein
MPKIFATNDPYQVIVLETVHNQRSMGWLEQEDKPEHSVMFDHNSEVDKHLKLWEAIQKEKLSDSDALHTYLYNVLTENSLHNFNHVFVKQEGVENE